MFNGLSRPIICLAKLNLGTGLVDQSMQQLYLVGIKHESSRIMRSREFKTLSLFRMKKLVVSRIKWRLISTISSLINDLNDRSEICHNFRLVHDSTAPKNREKVTIDWLFSLYHVITPSLLLLNDNPTLKNVHVLFARINVPGNTLKIWRLVQDYNNPYVAGIA